jgi:hypothetical protein
MDSILNSTKKTLGIAPDYSPFDPDIIMHINAALSIVAQLGVGPAEGLTIEDETDLWTGLAVGDNELPLVKNYVYLRCRLGFDPPQTSFAIEAIERQLTMLEFRLNVEREEEQWVDPEPAA